MEKRKLKALLVFLFLFVVFYFLSRLFTPILIFIPISLGIIYYLYPHYQLEKTKHKELEYSFIFSLTLASFSYIYKDVFNSLKYSLRSLERLNSEFIKEVKRKVWKNLTKSKNKKIEEEFKEGFIQQVDPSFPDVVLLLKNSLKERKNVLEGIKKSLTYHGNSIFSLILQKSSKSVNPIRVVFSILVVFPVFLLILLPLAVIFLEELINTPSIFVVFNILLPLLSLAMLEYYTIHLIPKPSFYSIKDKQVQYTAILFFILFSLALLISFFSQNSVYTLTSFFMASLAFYALTHLIYREDYKDLIEKYKLIEKFPAFFMVLAKQLAKGVIFERAMIEAEKKEGINLNSKMFLLGKDNLSTSQVLSNYSYFLDILREASKKDIVEEISEVISHYFNLRREAEEKIRFINEELYQSSKLLLILIIPIIAAVSASFSDSLEVILGILGTQELEFFSIEVETYYLTLILALYTFEMTIILTYFSIKLEGRKDVFYFFTELAKNMLKAFVVFTLTYLLSSYFINLSVIYL